ncbi:hypothetical protein [Fibrobacter sp. UWB10]|uniref:hypothetical protein n=1 Tax=Fibrobacter sp. UWB10 TaxID=1896201 RepID=UPI002402DC37|nr:hypothetical protein [Fibrobacter sp. UWB10]SMP46398.1 hypothetical protein SAMN05720465_1241 [Fibrobacter sp. UWB10]
MNKLIVFMVSLTLLLWGMFLWKMSNNVNAGKSPNTENVEQVTAAGFDMQGMLSLLEPQKKPAADLRDPFLTPKRFAPAPKPQPRVVKPKVDTVVQQTPQQPLITLDAILPGDNPVAIIKYHGETAVVSVGQKIWDVVITAIETNRVVIRYAGGTFEIK